MNREQLVERRVELETGIAREHATMNRLKPQIREAKTRRHTEHMISDPTWFRSTEKQIAEAGQRHQELCRELGAVNREIRNLGRQLDLDQRPFEAAFMQVSKETLHPTTFEALLELARERQRAWKAESRPLSIGQAPGTI